jgi:hypothetical protein
MGSFAPVSRNGYPEGRLFVCFDFSYFLEFEIEEREVGKKQNTEIFEDVDRTDWRKKIAKRGEAEKVPN